MTVATSGAESSDVARGYRRLMPWSLVNVPAPAVDAVVTGRKSPVRDLIEQVLADGYEPYAVTPLGTNQVMFSFKKFHEEGAEPTDDEEKGYKSIGGTYL